MLVVLSFLSSSAHAAEVTDMAPGMGGLVGFEYGGSSLSGRLPKGDEVVAGRRVTRHDIDLGIELAPIEGAALTLDLVYTPSLRFAYPDARTMVAEPTDGSGSYAAGKPLPETVRIDASGLQGVWVGAAVAPFAERYAGLAGTTWRLDAAFRTPSKGRNLWRADGDRRGAAPGGSATRLAGAFSSDLGVGNPWMQVVWVRESAVTVDVVDESGAEWGPLDLRPASTLDLQAGVELVGYHDPSAGVRFAVDLHLGGGYRSWEDVASGVYLPSVLDTGRAVPMTVGDMMTGRGGIAFDVHGNANVRGRAGLDFVYATPYRVEHLYDVTTSEDTWQLMWSFTLQAVGKVPEQG